ncbi:hypothetical protein C7212DRAFT_321451, partial [Tuber magnatum]
QIKLLFFLFFIGVIIPLLLSKIVMNLSTSGSRHITPSPPALLYIQPQYPPNF